MWRAHWSRMAFLWNLPYQLSPSFSTGSKKHIPCSLTSGWMFLNYMATLQKAFSQRASRDHLMAPAQWKLFLNDSSTEIFLIKNSKEIDYILFRPEKTLQWASFFWISVCWPELASSELADLRLSENHAFIIVCCKVVFFVINHVFSFSFCNSEYGICSWLNIFII